MPVHSPLFYLHLELEPGQALPMPAGEVAAYVVHGELETGGQRLQAGQMGVFSATANARATAASTVMLIGGEPVGERYIDWNFVSSHKERIEQAKADWQAGRFGTIPGDDAEFIPLPYTAAAPKPVDYP